MPTTPMRCSHARVQPRRPMLAGTTRPTHHHDAVDAAKSPSCAARLGATAQLWAQGMMPTMSATSAPTHTSSAVERGVDGCASATWARTSSVTSTASATVAPKTAPTATRVCLLLLVLLVGSAQLSSSPLLSLFITHRAAPAYTVMKQPARATSTTPSESVMAAQDDHRCDPCPWHVDICVPLGVSDGLCRFVSPSV
ncbi:hypothetical protein CDD82_1263 [Ophiocordyceps australis]|uniref:Uncharacterized protein n=1 Tax=Ophiocordyceps australis TaxID=1399860 RepID=A0A2C5XZR4_9HYPO|nr:hypothetical protein CDD82_1263 [Ophiocordyceps australis]